MKDLRSVASDWRSLWTGQFDLARRIIGESYRLHMSPVYDARFSQCRGPDGVLLWVRWIHSILAPMHIREQVPPVFGKDMIAVRWLAQGTYVGGVRGAWAAPGTGVLFSGADFLRVSKGKIVEHWANVDLHGLMTQFGTLADDWMEPQQLPIAPQKETRGPRP
jgi:hypothetical protein